MVDTTQYIQVGFLSITVANLVVIGLLVLVFALAVSLRPPLKHQVSIIEPPSAQVTPGTADTALEGQL